MTPSSGPASAPSVALRRALGFRDVVLMMVIAVVNLNTIPLLASSGWVAIPLWIAAGLLFLLPVGLAVAEFGKRYPSEGGLYVWTKELFGDFHAFISGWCYWTNNLFYFPSVLYILVGVLVYAGGPEMAARGNDPLFQAVGALTFLWLITLLHVRGLGTGKWLNNIGAVGTWVGMVILVAAALTLLSRTGAAATPVPRSGSGLPLASLGALSTFSIMLYSLVGIELVPVMGEEIRDMQRHIGRASLIAGVVCIVLYIIGTASLLIAMPADEISPVQGVMQAVERSFVALGIERFVPVVAVVAATALVGVTSAWISGAARIPFVMGVTAYLPPALGKVHARWGSPYLALIIQAAIASLLIGLSLAGSTVTDAYGVMLASSAVIQLIPFVYLFLGLRKIGRYRLLAAAATVATLFGIGFVFIPSERLDNILAYEAKLVAFPAVLLAAAFLFYFQAKKR